MSKTGLGRGFEGLIPTGLNIEDVATPAEHIKNISLLNIITNPEQPRKEFDQNSINELSLSIKQHGVIQPIIVTPTRDKKSDIEVYRIVAGERRFRASQIAGIEKIPAIVRNQTELEELEISLVENVQRVDLSPLEQAVSIWRLRDQFSLSLKDISKKLGKAETTVSNIVRLLQLPKQAIVALQKGRITEGHARAILALKNDEKLQKELLNNIITRKLSVRDAEGFVKKIKHSTVSKGIIPKNIQTRLNKTQERLGVKTKISQKSRGGIVQLSYVDNKQLENILVQLEK